MFQIIADSGCDLRGLSHISPDALFARAVCTRALRLDEDGLSEADFDRI